MQRLKGLLSLVLVVAGIYVAWQLVPPYFANYQFQDAVETEARLSVYSEKTEDDIRDAVFKKARELELPLRKEQIRVQRDAGQVNISTAYTVQVDLPGYPLELKFAPSSRNKR